MPTWSVWSEWLCCFTVQFVCWINILVFTSATVCNPLWSSEDLQCESACFWFWYTINDSVILAERLFCTDVEYVTPMSKKVVKNAIFFSKSLFYIFKFLKDFRKLGSSFWLSPTAWIQNLFEDLSQYIGCLCAGCRVAGLCIKHYICIYPGVMWVHVPFLLVQQVKHLSKTSTTKLAIFLVLIY